MKAIILAGGEGTRLRPMTARLPKPMVRLMDRPILWHTLEWLKRCGVTEAAVTLRYLPHSVRAYFGDGEDVGVRLTYFTETEPLGTAGAVRACGEFAGEEDVLVVSGDGVCDLDLRALADFHREHKAEATMLLYAHPSPTSYGIVQTDVLDRVVGFAEKPDWGQVFTDRVNTGIYLLSPAALRRIPPGKPFDFARDLFPRMVAERAALFAVCLPGYWRDVGEPEAYLACVKDALEGKIALSRPGEAEHLPEGATVEGPCYVSAEARVEKGCRIGPYTVLESGAELKEGATAVKSVVAGRIARNAESYGAVICRGAELGAGATAEPGAVLGEGARVGAGGQIAAGVRLWPDTETAPGMRVTESLRTGAAALPRRTENGLCGDLAREMTPGAFLRLGQAAAAMAGGKVMIAGQPLWAMLSMGAGVSSAGQACLAADSPLPAVTAWMGRLYGCRMSLDVREREGRVTVRIYDRLGLPLSPGVLSGLCAGLSAGAEPGNTVSGTAPRRIEGTWDLYVSLAAGAFPAPGFEAGARRGSPEARLMEAAGIRVREDATPFFTLSEDGASFTVRDGDGAELDALHAYNALCAAAMLSGARKTVPVPAWAPYTLETMAERAGGNVLRQGRDPGAGEALAAAPEFHHGGWGILMFCHLLQKHGVSVADLRAGLPGFVRRSRTVPAEEGRAACMHRLGQTFPDAERRDGLRIRRGERSAVVRPASGEEKITVTAEAQNAEFADELCADIEKAIRNSKISEKFDEK